MRIPTILFFALLTFIAAPAKFSVAEDVPKDVPGATTVDAERAKELLGKGAIFVDPRVEKDYEAGHIPGAIHLELKSGLTKESLAKEAGKGDEVVFYCNGPKCGRSSKAAAKAVGWGYDKVYYYYEGFPDWKSKGYPVE